MPACGLVREIREELEAEISVGDLLETVEWDYSKFHLTMHCFICTLLSESIHLNEIASSHMARRNFIGNIYKLVKDPNLLSALTSHVEGSRAFIRYRTIDIDMKKDLVKILEGGK